MREPSPTVEDGVFNDMIFCKRVTFSIGTGRVTLVMVFSHPLVRIGLVERTCSAQKPVDEVAEIASSRLRIPERKLMVSRKQNSGSACPSSCPHTTAADLPESI